MRANLVGREPARLAHWEQIDLYKLIQQKRAAAPAFVLHDGPPFTNGDVHIGTALNKTLKDITLRYKTMRGFRTPYVPGWDCHGLPIEQKVTQRLRAENKHVSTAGMRALCDAFSEEWIATQKRQFKRLGVLADWKNEYKTKAPAFEADILRTFAAFVEKGLVYRSKKPVYWSIPFETALAEAEIEYKDHVSPSIWVKFAVPAAEAEKFGLAATAESASAAESAAAAAAPPPLSVVIWTTTPWTIPANLAIAVHPEVDYVVACLGAERILVAAPLLDATLAAAKIDPASVKILSRHKGASLENLAPRHPFIDRASPVVLADYVTTASGTGCVHTAPGHGAEDYLTGLKYKLPIYCPVGDDGRYLDDGLIPADLVGLTTLETVEDLAKKRTSPANIAVLKKLAADGALLATARHPHSYPHCWRSKTPIIFRAVDQWFVALDQGGPAAPRPAALKAVSGVRWVPAWGETRIRGAVESRPDWCISRQRAWGVPLICFYDEKKNAWLDAAVIRAVAAKIAVRGTNYWYDAAPAEILDGIALPAAWPPPAALTRGRDTLDVWLDSGSSHAATLRRGLGGTQWPADLYLEGSDQHRGWFQSSLWTGIIAHGAAPYKTVLTHGFIVGKDGKKISKSGQYEKPPTSDNYINHYGADIIRLWVASQDFTQDITVSDLDKDLKDKGGILNIVAEIYRLFRNTFRYQLSNLFDFDAARDAVPLDRMDALDRWALHQTARLARECTAAYDAYEYHRVYQLCAQFCSATLSAVYHDTLKDRLYTIAAAHPLRRSSQTALHHIFRTLAKLLAPVLAFTADEAWAHHLSDTDFPPAGTGATGTAAAAGSIHLEDWPEPPAAWTDDTLDADFAALLKVRAQATEAIEPHRAAGEIGKSLDAALTITAAGDTAALLARHHALLPELFIVSEVRLATAAADAAAGGADAPPLIAVQHCQRLGYARCPRCWRRVPALQTTTSHGDVCPRCADALAGPPKT
ncbi:MAG: isoleucine--tRNA ligase [Opitutaceae bacterium]|nr:isoleucine--tRNA ligase [Opitutaceae bacterium]